MLSNILIHDIHDAINDNLPAYQIPNFKFVSCSGTGDAEEGSKKTGNAGGRVACGVIELQGEEEK